MSERIDHVIDANNSIANALHLAGEEEATSITHAMVASASATLALVEQQRAANMLAFAQFDWRDGDEHVFTAQKYALELRTKAAEALGLS